MPKQLQAPVRYAFKFQGETVDLYRKASADQRDSFGRQQTIEVALVGQVRLLLDQTSNLPDLTKTADKTTAIIKGKYYALLDDTSVKIGDTFEANSISWIVIKTVTVAALGINELYCESV